MLADDKKLQLMFALSVIYDMVLRILVVTIGLLETSLNQFNTMKIKTRCRLCICIVIVFVLMGTESCNKVTEDPIPVIEGTVEDIEGYVYKTIQIDMSAGLKKNLNLTQATTQVWMAENLRTTKYSNGDEIGTTTPATMDISAEATPKYQWAYLGSDSNVDTYGRLYTWFAVTDSRNVCPTGWHVPSEAEWTVLVNFLGGWDVAGGKLKESGLTHWSSPNTGAVNSIGFNALPAGYRYGRATLFDYLKTVGYWWTTTERPNYTNGYRRLGTYYTSQGIYVDDSEPNIGFSIRCIKD